MLYHWATQEHVTPFPRPSASGICSTRLGQAGLRPAPKQMAPDRMAVCQSWICFPMLQSCVYGICAFVLRCFFLFSHCTPQWSIVWGLNFFFFSSLSSCKCCIFLPFPVFLFCLPRCHMYVVYVWTGWWLISLVLVTSDNKGLLLLPPSSSPSSPSSSSSHHHLHHHHHHHPHIIFIIITTIITIIITSPSSSSSSSPHHHHLQHHHHNYRHHIIFITTIIIIITTIIISIITTSSSPSSPPPPPSSSPP